MRITEVIRISYKNLTSNKMRSLLTIVGIAVGIMSIVFLVSLGYGLQDLSVKKIASIEAINTIDVTQGSGGGLQKVDLALISKLEENKNIGKVSPVLALGIKLKQGDRSTDAVGNFVDENFFTLEGLKLSYGKFIAKDSNEMIISSGLLKAIDQTSEKVIDQTYPATIIISDNAGKRELAKTFKVVGIVNDDSTALAYVSLSQVKDEIGASIVYNSLKIKVTSVDKIQETKQQIQAMGFTATSVADTINQVNQIFRIIQIALAFFGFIALLVASIGMFNTMTVALLERTRDIGIMKAIGVRDSDVAKMFLAESAMIAFSGGALGVSSGWILSKVINFAVNRLAISVGGQANTLFATPPIFAFGIVAFSFLVGITTGFYPSKRASRLNPLDALRYE